MASQSSQDDDGSIIVPVPHDSGDQPSPTENADGFKISHYSPEPVVNPQQPNIPSAPVEQNNPPVPPPPTYAAPPAVPDQSDNSQQMNYQHMPEFMRPRPNVDQNTQQPTQPVITGRDEKEAYFYTDPNAESKIDISPTANRRSIPKKGFFIAFVTVVVLVSAFFAITAVSHKNPKLSKYILVNAGYTYNIEFFNNSKTQKIGAVNSVVGIDKGNHIAASAYPAQNNVVCNAILPGAEIPTVYSVAIDKNKVPVCTGNNDSVLFSTFNANGQWQEIAVYSTNNKTPLIANDFKAVFESVTTNKY